MRILYVALTRAKEKLIITGIDKDTTKKTEELNTQINRYEKSGKKINPILLKKYKKFLDWILLVYYYEKENLKDILNLNIYTKQNIIKKLKDNTKDDVNIIEKFEEKKQLKNNIQKLEEILNYSYPQKDSITIPTKTSVTIIKLMKQQIEEKDDIELAKPEFLRSEKQEKLTSAQIGTLIHLCMQKLDEKKEYNLQEIKDLIEDLNNKEIITTKEKESINPYIVLNFTKNKIWKELKEAKEIYKEKPFYINIPAKEIYDNQDIEDNVLVQGVIDLYYIDKDDNIVLVDYKTDYVQNKEELIQKYYEQLKLYKKAIEYAHSKKVSKVYIYSTFLNELIDITSLG